MKLDLEKAFVYISKDSAWVNKLIAGSGILFAMYAIFIVPALVYIFTSSTISFIASFIASFCVSFILSCGFSGFIAETANKRINYNNAILPDWKNFGIIFRSGLKYFIGYCLYLVPVLILSGVFLILLTFWLGGINNTGIQDAFVFVLLTLLGTIFLSFTIVYFIFSPLMMANFYKDLKILSFVDFKSAFSMLKGHGGSYFVLILIFLAFSFLLQTIISILAISIVGIILIPAVYFYFYLIIAEIVAQFVIESKQE